MTTCSVLAAILEQKKDISGKTGETQIKSGVWLTTMHQCQCLHFAKYATVMKMLTTGKLGELLKNKQGKYREFFMLCKKPSKKSVRTQFLFCFEEDVIPTSLLLPPLFRCHLLGQDCKASIFQENHIFSNSEWFETDISRQPFGTRSISKLRNSTHTLMCICSLHAPAPNSQATTSDHGLLSAEGNSMIHP